MEKTNIPVSKPKCLNCGHLVSFGKEVYDCHYSRGFNDCPAKVFEIKLAINLEEKVQGFLALEDAGKSTKSWERDMSVYDLKTRNQVNRLIEAAKHDRIKIKLVRKQPKTEEVV